MTDDKAHRCDVPGCDGTRLGHDLASEFPEETGRFDEAMDHLRQSRGLPVTNGEDGTL